ncbi:MAG: DUF1080 domain-containing protein [Planctomycetia bacterium]
MHRPLSIVACAIACVASGLLAAEPAARPAEATWQSLFNGRNLEGWDGDRRLWSVRDGVIHGETTPDLRAEGNTFLIRQGLVLEDFELTLSFRCTAANNSGIQYRSRHIADQAAKPANAWVVRGYQHELRNEARLPDVAGFIYDEGGKRGRICLVGERAEWVDGAKRVTGELIDAAGYARLFKLDDWNEVRIVAAGRRIRHFMNGTLTLDFTDGEDVALRRGILALQLHAGAPMWAEFKDIAVRPIAAE